MSYMMGKKKPRIPSLPAVQRLGPGNRWVPDEKPEQVDDEERDPSEYFRRLFESLGRKPGGKDDSTEGR